MAAFPNGYAKMTLIASSKKGLVTAPGYGCYYDEFGWRQCSGSFTIYVGIPFETFPTASCNDGASVQGSWNAKVNIFSGKLPPGLELLSGFPSGKIAGVPTRAGTWHLRMAFDVDCAGLKYDRMYQDLTITATGN